MPRRRANNDNDLNRGDIDRGMGQGDQEYMAGLEKGLDIIEAFGVRGGRLTVTEAATITGYSRAAARRCLRTLERLHYAQCDGKYYRLAPRVIRLGNAYLASDPITRGVQPIIEDASERIRESISVSIFDGTDVLIVARAVVRRTLSTGLWIGSRLPAYCSANGRVLLSNIPDAKLQPLLARMNRPRLTVHTKTEIADIMQMVASVRTSGYSVNDQEVELGLRSIAMPVRSRDGQIVASISQQVSDLELDLRRAPLTLLQPLDAVRTRLANLL